MQYADCILPDIMHFGSPSFVMTPAIYDPPYKLYTLNICNYKIWQI